MSTTFQLSAPLASKRHLPVVDQLKGWAMFLVLLYHGGGMLNLPNRWSGQIGVDLFLALSGFTLALGSVDLPAREFFTRRFLRIFPTYWAALALFVVLDYLATEHRPDLLNLGLHIVGLHGLGNDVQFFAWAEAFWFIGLIVPLYLVTMLIRRWVDRLDVVIGVAGGAAMAMAWYARSAGHVGAESHLAMRIPVYFLGLAIGRIALGRRMRLDYSPWLVLGGGGIYYCITQLGNPLSESTAAIGLLVAWLGLQGLAGKIAPGRWLLGAFAYLGAISYEVYLFHQPLMRNYTRRLLHDRLGLAQPTPVQMFLGMMTMLAAIIVAATALKIFKLKMKRKPVEFGWSAAALLVLLGLATGIGWRVLQPGPPNLVRLKVVHLAAMADGASEPLACAGVRTEADLVFLKHQADGSVRIAIDHWGAGGPTSEPVTQAALEAAELTVEFSAQAVTVTGPGGKVWLTGSPPHHPEAKIHVGVNEVGFSMTKTVAESRVVAIP